MTYTATMSSSGQIAIPKALRNLLGLEKGSKVTVEEDGGVLQVRRKETIEEVLRQIDARRTPAQRAAISQNAGKSYEELRDAWADSPEGARQLEERYGA